MNSCICIEMERNSFYINTNCCISGMHIYDVPFKIDTGCSISTIPYCKLISLNSEELLDLKKIDIENNVPYVLSYGVESSGMPHTTPVTVEEKLSCSAMKFQHLFTELELDGYKLPDLNFHINYDRRGNILIGMNILKLFDIHIGTSKITGKTTLVALLQSQKDKSEYNALIADHFGIVDKESQVAKGFRSVFRGLGKWRK